MAILGLPSLAMVDHEPIAAITTIEFRRAGATDHDVRHLVAGSQNHTISSGQNVDALGLSLKGMERKIRSLMAVIDKVSAHEIRSTRSRIAVHELLDEAILVKRAVDGLLQPGLCRDHRGQKQKDGQQSQWLLRVQVLPQELKTTLKLGTGGFFCYPAKSPKALQRTGR